MFTLKHELETIGIILFATAICLFLFTRQNNKIQFHNIAPMLPDAAPTPTPKPLGATQVTRFASPDGTKTLIMKKQTNNNRIIYSFFITSEIDNSEKLIFTKTEDETKTLTIPFNTWSPDNAYFFIKEEIGGVSNISNYYAFSATGTPDSNAKTINIRDQFVQKYPNYTLTQVTGWASPTLLVINTNTNQHEIGPSLWFEVPSGSFIQLSTRFN